MINKQADPVAWALLMHELEDAEEGLESLFNDTAENEAFDEAAFRVHMAHIYAHLNRAWNGRNATEAQHNDESVWNKWSQFPTDIEAL